MSSLERGLTIERSSIVWARFGLINLNFLLKVDRKKMTYFKLYQYKCIRYTLIELSLAKNTDWRAYNGKILYT